MVRKKRFISNGSRIALLCFQLVLVLLCASYIEYVYYADIYPERQVKKTFISTPCQLINSRMSVRGQQSEKYRADFLISYVVKGVQYNRWVSGNGLEMLFTKEKALQDELLNKYKVGNQYTCWYNPVLPQVSVLIPKHNWQSALPLLLPFIIGLIALVFFFRNLLLLPNAGKEKLKTNKRN